MSEEGADCGWNFFIRNMEGITESLHPPTPPPAPANNRAVGGSGAVTFAATGPTPRVKLRWVVGFVVVDSLFHIYSC